MSVEKVFVDTLKFATDSDLKIPLSALMMLQISVNNDIDLLDLIYIQLYIMLIF